MHLLVQIERYSPLSRYQVLFDQVWDEIPSDFACFLGPPTQACQSPRPTVQNCIAEWMWVAVSGSKLMKNPGHSGRVLFFDYFQFQFEIGFIYVFIYFHFQFGIDFYLFIKLDRGPPATMRNPSFLTGFLRVSVYWSGFDAIGKVSILGLVAASAIPENQMRQKTRKI